MKRGPCPPWSLAWWAVALAILGLIGAGVHSVPSGHVVPGATFGSLSDALAPQTGGPSWSNGVVTVAFSSTAPSFSLAALADPTDRVNQTIAGVAEIDTTGAIVAFAAFESPNASWLLTDRSTPAGTDVALNGTVPVINFSGEWESGDTGSPSNESVGTVNVSFVFLLNASAAVDPWTVEYALNVSGWPWANTSDALGLDVRSSLPTSADRWVANGPSGLAAEHGASHARFANYLWNPTAQIFSGGGQQASPVGSYTNFSGGGSSSLVRLEFGSVVGGYPEVSYDPWLGLVPVAGPVAQLAALVLNPTSLAILGAGAIGTAVLAIWTRSRRTPPESGL